MSIRAPIGRTGLVGLAAGKEALRKRTRKNLAQSLNLTAMVDFMSVLVIFLLLNFSTQPEDGVVTGEVRLPVASFEAHLEVAPVVTVSETWVTMEGRQLVPVSVLLSGEGDGDMGALERALEATRAAFGVERPGEAFDAKLVVAADQEVPYKAIRRVFDVAAKVGYVRVSYVVQRP